MLNIDDPGLDYELAWPCALFVDEATAVLRLPSTTWTDDAELLLEEAFAGTEPKDDLRRVTWKDLPVGVVDLWAAARIGGDAAARGLLTHLVSTADILPERCEPSPCWSARSSARPMSESATAPDTAPRLQLEWAQLVERLKDRGYLERVAPRTCADRRARASDIEVLNAETAKRLGVAGLWPLDGGSWDTEVFYSLIECVHDLLARPRHREPGSDSCSCRWHYSNFAQAPARDLYRCQVDQLLARYGVDLHLSADGVDMGRLVHTPGGGREDLVLRALGSRDPGVRDDVGHAAALFRGRTATTADRRSAVVTLAGALERHRALLKVELFSTDEGALFYIANEFDLRHRDRSQQGDYDPIFLDWLFWWYLATVELTDRLLARQTDTP
jgi:hypothetical protein